MPDDRCDDPDCDACNGAGDRAILAIEWALYLAADIMNCLTTGRRITPAALNVTIRRIEHAQGLVSDFGPTRAIN